MTIRKSTRRGMVRWVVHVRDDSSGNAKPYRELTFKSRVQAEDFVGARAREKARLGEALLTLSPTERADLAEAVVLARNGGFRLVDAVKAMSARIASPTLQEAFDEYYSACVARGIRPRSLASLRLFPRVVIEANAGRRIGEIRAGDIERLVSVRWPGAVSRRTALRHIGAWMNWAVRRGYIASNPVILIDRPVVEHSPPRILTVPEASRLMHVTADTDPGMIPYVAICLFAGLRPESEVMRLRREHIQIDRGFIEVHATGKTRRRRLVSIKPNLKAWLAQAPEVWTPAPSRIRARWRVIREAAGWSSTAWPRDGMRHSFVSYHYALHGETETAMQAGHSAAVLHQHYRELVTREDGESFFAIRPS